MIKIVKTKKESFSALLFLIPKLIMPFLCHLAFFKALQKSKKDGQTGIRTLDTLLTYTRFPVVRLKPNSAICPGKTYSIADLKKTASIPIRY